MSTTEAAPPVEEKKPKAVRKPKKPKVSPSVYKFYTVSGAVLSKTKGVPQMRKGDLHGPAQGQVLLRKVRLHRVVRKEALGGLQLLPDGDGHRGLDKDLEGQHVL